MEEKVRFVFEYERDEHTMSGAVPALRYRTGNRIRLAPAIPAVWGWQGCWN